MTAGPATPIVAIVGRPNVGKSTLFNRLVGRRQAIVHDQPGVTRDRVHGVVRLGDGREVHLVDTGGLVAGDDPLGVGRAVLRAVEESDALLFVVDGIEGLVAADELAWDAVRARSRHKPAFVVVNKIDARKAREGAAEFFRLAPTVLPVSAEHGEGIADLREALVAALRLPALAEVAGEEPGVTPPPAVAIVGRPNVGKSSLLNRLAGTERSLVSPQPGTTRDPVDTLVVRGDRSYLLVDTAGIRRRSKAADTPEELAVLLARRQAERADIVVLVLDAGQGITTGDLAIAGMAWQLGRPAVVVAAKWDLVDEEARLTFERDWPRLSDLLGEPRRVNLSSLTGRGIEKLLPALDDTLAAARRSVGTSELNRLLESALRRHRAPAGKRPPWKVYYATQVAVAPPTFMLFVNRGLTHADPYRRYLEGFLRESLGFEGVPIRLVLRRKAER